MVYRNRVEPGGSRAFKFEVHLKLKRNRLTATVPGPPSLSPVIVIGDVTCKGRDRDCDRRRDHFTVVPLACWLSRSTTSSLSHNPAAAAASVTLGTAAAEVVRPWPPPLAWPVAGWIPGAPVRAGLGRRRGTRPGAGVAGPMRVAPGPQATQPGAQLLPPAIGLPPNALGVVGGGRLIGIPGAPIDVATSKAARVAIHKLQFLQIHQ